MILEKDKIIGVRLTSKDYMRLVKAATKKGVRVSEYVRDLIRESISTP